jgi:hypothetical protein
VKRTRLLAALAILLLGCGDSSTGPPALHDIELRFPASVTPFMVNDTIQLIVVGRDQSGTPYPAGPVTWRSRNPAVIHVDSVGRATGLSTGAATLVANVGPLADSVTLDVTGTRHRWPIVASETWSLAGSPHLVNGRLNVSRAFGGSAILTIEAGVTVIFTDTSGLTFGMNGAGRLRAMGTPSAPIILRDTATSTISGAWVGLTFRSSDSSELHNVTLRGCGRSRSDNDAGCLVLGHYIFGPFPTVRLDNVTVERGAGGAVILSRNSHLAAGSSGLAVRNMRGHIATLPAREASAFPTGSTFSANDTAEVRLLGDTLRDTTSWSPSIPWVVMGPVYIEGMRQPVLTIPAGITLPFDFGASLVVGKNAPGELRVGSGGGPTSTLRARRTDWAGVAFWPAAKPGTISNAVLENCGNYGDTGYGQACVTFIGNFFGSAPAPVLTDVTIRGATGFGVVAVGGGRFGDGSANVTITGTINYGSPGAPFSFYETSPASIPSGSYTGNASDTIWVSRVEVTRSETWRNHGVPYLIREGLAIGHARNPILTLEPGVELRFTPGGLLSVAWLATGGVRAIGTAAEPILITGQYGPGSWGGAVLGVYADSATQFEHVVMDGGAFEVRRDIGPVIRNTLTKNSGGCAITRVSGSPWVTDFTVPALANTFQDNVGPDQCGP